MPTELALTDPSCLHAALGTLLRIQDPAHDPAAVLGNTASTRARITNKGLVFDDVIPALAQALDARGHRLTRRPFVETGTWLAMLDLLRSGESAVVDADTYYLDHYWVDRRHTHALHALVLTDLSADQTTVRVIDPVDVTFFDGQIALTVLEPALAATQIGQAWLHLTPAAPQVGNQNLAIGEFAAHAECLAGSGGAELSGVELAAFLRAGLDALFADGLSGSFGTSPTDLGPDGVTPSVDQAPSWFLHGLWTYHHTLRWFAKYLGTASLPDGSPLTVTAAAVDRAAQDWLVVRALLRLAGAADGERKRRHRAEVARRLDRIVATIGAAGASVAGAGLPTGWTGHPG